MKEKKVKSHLFEPDFRSGIKLLNPYSKFNKVYLSVILLICHATTGCAHQIFGATLTLVKENTGGSDNELSLCLPFVGIGMIFASIFSTIFADTASKRPTRWYSLTLVRFQIVSTLGVAVLHFLTPSLTGVHFIHLRMLFIGFFIQFYFIIGYIMLVIIWEEKSRTWIHAYNAAFYLGSALTSLYCGFVYGLHMDFRNTLYGIYYGISFIGILSVLLFILPSLPYKKEKKIKIEEIQKFANGMTEKIIEEKNYKGSKKLNLIALSRRISINISEFELPTRSRCQVIISRYLFLILATFLVSTNVCFNSVHNSLLFSYTFRSGIANQQVSSVISTSYQLCTGLGTVFGTYLSRILSNRFFIIQGFTLCLFFAITQIIFPMNVYTSTFFSSFLALVETNLQAEFYVIGVQDFGILFTPFENSILGFSQSMGLIQAGICQWIFSDQMFTIVVWDKVIFGLLVMGFMFFILTSLMGTIYNIALAKHDNDGVEE